MISLTNIVIGGTRAFSILVLVLANGPGKKTILNEESVIKNFVVLTSGVLNKKTSCLVFCLNLIVLFCISYLLSAQNDLAARGPHIRKIDNVIRMNET